MSHVTDKTLQEALVEALSFLGGVPSGASGFPLGSVSQKQMWWWVPAETVKLLELWRNIHLEKTHLSHWLAHNFPL